MVVPPADTVLAFVGTFVVATLFYAVAAHLAATYVLGDVSIWRALLVGPVPAAVTLGVGVVWAPAVPVVAVPADFLVIQWSYDLERRLAAGVTLGHVVISVLLAVSLAGLAASLGVI